MPENRLARTRNAYESTDPMNRLARIYIQHTSFLIRAGRAAEAVSTLDEALRILGVESHGAKAMPRLTAGLLWLGQ